MKKTKINKLENIALSAISNIERAIEFLAPPMIYAVPLYLVCNSEKYTDQMQAPDALCFHTAGIILSIGAVVGGARITTRFLDNLKDKIQNKPYNI